MSTTRPISTTATSYGPDRRLVVGYNFAGDMSLVQVYDRVLSEQEIQENYNAFRIRYGS
jgi:hypothetical protein